MEKVTLPECKKGLWSVEKFVVDRTDFHALLHGRDVPFGTYTRLMHDGHLVMSDTPAEMRDHSYAVHKAQGHCLINGLGLGMVLKNILLKKEVTKVTVVEIDQDLIDLISPHYKDSRIEFVCADALKYKPPKDAHYGMCWHDIWIGICSDNLEDMKKLHRKYGRKSDWQGSWCRCECER
jgi:predicted membrane-bound spermidine synthase